MEEPFPIKNKETKNQNSRLNDYAKYSGLAFQMGAIIGIAAWGGVKLDELVETNQPTFTIILSLFGVFAAIYITVKDLIRK